MRKALRWSRGAAIVAGDTDTDGVVLSEPNTIKGNNTGTAAAPADLTGTQITAMLDVVTALAKGLVPPPGSPTGKVLGDGLAWVPNGEATLYTATVNFTTAARSGIFDVTVTGVTVGQKVVAAPSLDMPSGVAEDELDMDPITVAARVTATNTVRLAVSSTGILYGQRNINLMVG